MGRSKLKKKETLPCRRMHDKFSLVAVVGKLAGWLAHGQRYSYGEGRERGSVKSDLDRECHVAERDSSRG